MFSGLLALQLPHLGKRELICLLFLHLFDLHVFVLSLSSSSWRQGLPLTCDCVSELLKYCLQTLYRNSCSGLEVKRGLKSNSFRSGQPTYEACDDNLDARI